VALTASVATQAEVTATHDAIISFNSKIFPRVLPRHGSTPVSIQIDGHVKARSVREPAAMTKIELAIHHAARLLPADLPVCDLASIDPATPAKAMAVCGSARIGYGRIRAQSKFPGSHFFYDGRALLFNGRLPSGRRAILIHVFNARPPSSFVFPFAISHRSGRYGTVLSADVHLGRWSQITDFKLVLGRSFRHGGSREGFLNASCPAPKGFSIGISPFVRATLSFADGTKSQISVVSSCKVAS
jgi:hypothetical protein